MADVFEDTQILIVDDSMSIRHLIKAALRSYEFYNAIEAEDGQRALKTLRKKNKIGLVISDWEMPNMDGVELFENMLKDSKLSNIPFILLTSHGEKDKVKHAITRGIKNYIVKPFTPQIVHSKVKAVLQ